MTNLRDLVEIRHRSVRAVNLDEDLRDPDVLRGYAPGEHVIDALRRIVISLQDEPRTRAWSITGPYGSGKSSFAHLLCAILAGREDPTFRVAHKLLQAADPQLAETIQRERKRLGIEHQGVIAAAVSSDREPVAQAVLRGLCRGAELYWHGPGRKPKILHDLRAATKQRAPGSEAALHFFEELVATAPVLLVVDELGKNLEYAADHGGEGDLYLLQQLAERLSSWPLFAGGVLTLAHLAFEDYLLAGADARRREWRKVHGRFEDIPFIASTAHSVALLAEALQLKGSRTDSDHVAAATARAEQGVRRAAAHAALPGELTGDPKSTYPLHPTVTVALPALAARLGQHDRSLVAFLTSDARHALPAFLSEHSLAARSVPFVRLADVYAYFFEDGAPTVLTGTDGERAREVQARIAEARGLDPFEQDVLKTVGLLNLVGTGTGLLANADLVEEALVGPAGTRAERRAVVDALVRLTERSLLAYRDFAGEYRVWEGSDFDISGQLAATRERLTTAAASDERVLAIVAEAYPLRPAVARRHSQQHHLLRYFESRYTNRAPTEKIETSADDADGLVLYVLTDDPAPKTLPDSTTDGLPMICVWSPHAAEVRDAALNFAAAEAVLTGAPELNNDPVARRELRHRVVALQAILADRIDDVFSHTREGVVWFAAGRRRKARGPAEFSRLLSERCDKRYPRTPVIRNEMVNRRELTSQGAKARRVLLERMFTHEHEPRFGIEGYGPERAMYEAVLHHTGLHLARRGQWGLGPPPPSSDLADVWDCLMGLLDAATDKPVGVDVLYEKLLGPPFGMKVGAVPLLLAAALQHRADDVFLYQDRSFQPVVDPAHIERLLKAPERFSVKRASLTGLRASVFEQLRTTLVNEHQPSPRRIRNETTLAVVRPLMSFADSLPEYTRRTTTTSETSQRVCAALLNAREPDELLFTALPEACGVTPFAPPPAKPDEQAATEYVDRLRQALAELASSYQRLLEHIGDLLHAGFAVEGPRTALREDLRTRSRRLLRQVIEPKMRAFLSTAADDKLDDDDWLEALAMTLAAKPASSWTDHDVVVFEALVIERSQWFRRLEVLWHQMHATQGGGFDARRVTLTAPDGAETAELVSVDQGTCELVDDVLDRALAELDSRIGTRAERALLGVLATRLLSSTAATTEDAATQARKAEEA